MIAGPQKDDLVETLHALAKQADTSYVIVATTALEELLETAVKTKMRDGLSKKVHNQIFGGYGSLSTFAAKIDIAYALEIIGDDLRGDFDAIRAIRNAFAHARKTVHFGSPELETHFQKFSGWTKTSDQRVLFDARLQACANALNRHVNINNYVRALRGNCPC